jgi:colicin import membrane protein
LSEVLEAPQSNALVVAGAPVTAITLFAQGGVETILSRLEAEVRSVKRDISTPRGRKEIKSLAFKVARSKTALDEMGKDLNEAKRAEINKVDADRRVIRERCDALKEEVLSELTAWEAKEAARVKGHEDALAAISALAVFDGFVPDSELLRLALERLDRAEEGRDWQEYAQRASDLHAEVGFKLTNLLNEALAREEEAAEAERRRLEAEEAARQAAARQQRERETRIAAEAAEKARLEAEARAAEAAAAERQRVEQERLDAEDARRQAEEAAQAELDALEEANRVAEAKAREAEERAARAEREKAAAIEAERQRVAAEKAAEEKAAAERARNLEIKRRVNFDAAAALVVHARLTEEQAQAVVIAIAKRQVPAVEIRY